MHQFGLIGNPLSHSFSKKYFTNKFFKENIDYAHYELYPLKDIKLLKNLIDSNTSLKGLNVTIPYKEAVIPYLDELDSISKEISAVNTIKINHTASGKKLQGYNTDVIGFKKSLKPFLATNHERALILGTGGSSKAIAYVLKELNIPYYFVSRKPENSREISYSDIDPIGIKAHKLIINCTPLGMSPELNKIPPIPIEGIGSDHLVYDLIYNPEETLLLKESKKRGAISLNGLSMLKLQAEASWEIWMKDL